MPTRNIRTPEVPPALAGWVLVDGAKRPRFWPTIWDGILRRGNEGTRGRHLGNIERFYISAERTLGSDRLDEVISSRNFDRLEVCLTSYLASLQNDAARRAVDLSGPWKSALMFTKSVMSHLGADAGHRLNEIDARLRRLQALYSQVSPNKKKKALPIRALPAKVVEELIRIFDPGSTENPFEGAANRVRNHLMFSAYLMLGLRRGEGIILSYDSFRHETDLISGREIFWLNITNMEQEDPRYYRPSLKTYQSERQIPVSEDMLDLVDLYRNNYRVRSQYSQLLISQKGAPLAPQSVSDIFAKATLALSSEAKGILEGRGWSKIGREQPTGEDRGRKRWVSPHDLRHTRAVVLLKSYIDAGDEMEAALGKLRTYFGWSYTSKMPHLYARAYWLTDAAEREELRFDKFVGSLRQVDRSLASRAT